MNLAMKKTLCIIQVLCTPVAVQADWVSELKELFKICAIAGTSVFIYSKWANRARKVNSNAAVASGSSVKQNDFTSEEQTKIKQLLRKFDESKETRLSSQEIAELREMLQKKDEVGKVEEIWQQHEELKAKYDRLVAFKDTIFKIVRQLNTSIKEHKKIIGDGFNDISLTDKLLMVSQSASNVEQLSSGPQFCADLNSDFKNLECEVLTLISSENKCEIKILSIIVSLIKILSVFNRNIDHEIGAIHTALTFIQPSAS